MDFLRELVSQEKVRYIDDRFNLDLTYITPRIIAMAYPAEGIESMFRNKITDVAEFFNTKHENNYLIINCSNRKYDYSFFNNKVQDIKWPNHYPCPVLTFFQTILTSANFLLSKKDHIISVHCLAGKGRTGSLITAILYISKRFKTIEEANNFYLCKRAVHVDRPSQLRYLNYFKSFYDIGFKNMNFSPKRLKKIVIRTSQIEFFEQKQCRVKIYDFERDSLQLANIEIQWENFKKLDDGYVFISEVNQKDNFDSTEILVNLDSKGLVKAQKLFRVNYSLFFVESIQKLQYKDLDVPNPTLPKDFVIELHYESIDNVELLQNWIFQFKDVLLKLEDIKKVLEEYNKKEDHFYFQLIFELINIFNIKFSFYFETQSYLFIIKLQRILDMFCVYILFN